jgi:hypothetical protein
VADFLSDEWFTSLNETLRAAGPVPFEHDGATFRIVFEFPDAPSSVPHAMTFTLSPQAVTVERGDHLAADALVRLSYADAVALSAGRLDSASALREGRIKVRGDISAIVPLLGFLQRAHPRADV